jgi:hypothetical protein
MGFCRGDIEVGGTDFDGTITRMSRRLLVCGAVFAVVSFTKISTSSGHTLDWRSTRADCQPTVALLARLWRFVTVIAVYVP